MKSLIKLTKGKRKAVFLDFEGTQFSHEIIAIGAVKCELDEKGQIIKKDKYEDFKVYVKSIGQIGKICQKITGINESILKEKGIPLEEAFDQFNEFISSPFDEYAFFVFGSNDAKMIIESINYSRPTNKEVGHQIIKNTIDYLMFISQYVRDKNGNNYSLVSYLELFGGKQHGISHDPLNDAYDLMNLYSLFLENKELKESEYKKVLASLKSLPEPIKKIVNKLLNEENVTSEEFSKEISSYLE